MLKHIIHPATGNCLSRNCLNQWLPDGTYYLPVMVSDWNRQNSPGPPALIIAGKATEPVWGFPTLLDCRSRYVPLNTNKANAKKNRFSKQIYKQNFLVLVEECKKIYIEKKKQIFYYHMMMNRYIEKFIVNKLIR